MASDLIALVLELGRIIIRAIADGRDDQTSTDDALAEIDALALRHRAEYERARDTGR